MVVQEFDSAIVDVFIPIAEKEVLNVFVAIGTPPALLCKLDCIVRRISSAFFKSLLSYVRWER